jgi:glycosyltransferase involved in cell wall biosynthesis
MPFSPPTPKRVLQLDFTGSWERGGCLSHIARAWARNARAYEHHFTSWAGAGHRGQVEGRPHYGFEEHRLANKIYNKILRLEKSCFFSLPSIIEEVHPAILHFHNRHDLVDAIVARLSYRPKVVCTYHCCYDKVVVPATSDLLLGVGKSTVAWIDGKANPAQPMAVLHNPYWKVPLPSPREKPQPVFLTYTNQRKATRDLFTAVTLLRREGFAFSLRTVGQIYDGLAIPEGVTATGFVPQSEFLSLLENASAYLCASYGTTFSVAVLEAIARRIPVLCPWDIGALDLLPADCVLSYESHSAAEIAGALRRFLQMLESERAALAERALEGVSVYDEALITAKLERLYDTLFARS